MQGEIDTERENFLSLTANGRKLLTNLDGNEDAGTLQRRLEEMNQRWNYLKAKSIAIRYVPPVQKKFQRFSRNRVNLLSYKTKPTDKREQYN